jgi:dephospho-CoA kinase
MRWIGLTGGIATGKSAAKKIIEENGFPVIDADLIAHQISQIGQAGYLAIVEQFGPSILQLDGALDRKKLGEIIFKSEEQKLRLEGLLHPLIQTVVSEQKAVHLKAGHKLCFYDVPLLFEKVLQRQFDTTILIWCDAETQLSRLVLRNNLSPEQALDRIKSQMPLIEKLPLASHCIDNSSTLDSLHLQVTTLLKKIAAV